MKAVLLTLFAAIVVVQCKHLFLGTNVNRPMVYHVNVQTSGKMFKKTIDNVNYQFPNLPSNYGRAIQGILAVNTKFSEESSANVTSGGIGFNHVNIRMKSERGKGLHYDIYIFA